MNKNLIAIAITAALAVPSIAAAEVKIIGQAQLELVNTSSDVAAEGLTLDDSAQAKTMGKSNASAIGITGSHDLGNGMTGLYKINFNFHADEVSDGGLSGRDKFVGLKGDFGTVLLGTINSPYKTSTVKYDPFLATFMQARGNNGMSTALHNSYASNVIAYANKFGSVKFVGAVALDEPSADTPLVKEVTAADAYTYTVVDDNGDNQTISVAEVKAVDAAPAQVNDGGDHLITFSVNFPIADSVELAIAYLDNAALDDATAVKVGAKWTSGDLTIAGQFETLDVGLGDEDLVYVTASMKMGGGASISAGFGQSTDNTDAENDGTYMAVGYKKALSKKVSWHAGVTVSDEGVATADNDITRIGGGIRVKF